MTVIQKKITDILVRETELDVGLCVFLASEIATSWLYRSIPKSILKCDISLLSVPEHVQERILATLRPNDCCVYCGQLVEDTSFTVDDGVAHKACYESAWQRVYAEIEKDFQSGNISWHVVKGKIERRKI